MSICHLYEVDSGQRARRINMQARFDGTRTGLPPANLSSDGGDLKCSLRLLLLVRASWVLLSCMLWPSRRAERSNEVRTLLIIIGGLFLLVSACWSAGGSVALEHIR